MAAPDVLDRETTDLDVVNTTVETTVFTHSVPANTLGATGMLHFVMVADYLDNSGSASDIDLRIKFGGTTIYHDRPLMPLSGSRRPVFVEFWLANQNATNDQTGGGFILFGTAGGTIVGLGNLELVGNKVPIVSADSALDTTAAQTFEVTIQWDVANASNSFRRRLAVLTLY